MKQIRDFFFIFLIVLLSYPLEQTYSREVVIAIKPSENFVRGWAIAYLRKIFPKKDEGDQKITHLTFEVPIVIKKDNINVSWHQIVDVGGIDEFWESVTSYTRNHGRSYTFKLIFKNEEGKRITPPLSALPQLLFPIRYWSQLASENGASILAITGMASLACPQNGLNGKKDLLTTLSYMRKTYHKGILRFDFLSPGDLQKNYTCLNKEHAAVVDKFGVDVLGQGDEVEQTVAKLNKLNVSVTRYNQSTVLKFAPPYTLTQEEMGYHRSFLFDQRWDSPISEEAFYVTFIERGLPVRFIKNISLLQKLVYDENHGFHHGAHINGGDERGFSIFSSFAHENDVTFSLKMYASSLTPGQQAEIPPSHEDEVKRQNYFQTYQRALIYYARWAHQHVMEEIVIGTGIARWGCEAPEEFANIIATVRKSYPIGRIRLDFKDLEDFKLYRHCLVPFEKDIVMLGVDLPPNPKAEAAQEILAKGHLLSRITFDGPPEEQDKKGAEFLMTIPQKSPLSLGIFSPGETALDNTENVRGKPWLQTIKNAY